ncbi:tetratricopeptide repeat protein [Marinobacter sp. SS13-12]|uniref:tetratricopeptide repeat protein n=1 Tax=Marinobacter sp. SS13-12 TaxID=3050451 RepID=UPI00255535CC|nr:tetratricopeptide repeat protein [Marinobacter sp. SS13-12]MDK8465906.1 tetratricopeptide repeat protein [Marinobacter sp. SS13-12]
MPENRLSNLVKDLTKAKQQALLIEVLQSDLATWSNQGSNAFRTVCDASAKVFDVGAKDGKTNVLVVGETESQGPISIFSALLDSLDEEFDDIHKREILEKLTGFGLSQALGGGLGDTVGESLNVGAEKMMDYLAEWTGSASDFMASAFETGIETVAEQSGDLLETVGETGAEAVTGHFSSDNEMYLSRPARKRLKELAPRLSEKVTSHEVLQLALQMFMVTTDGAPKVIVVKDPLQLDDASLALLAMLVSLEKDLRQVNHTDDLEQSRVQTAGISVVLTFTGPQPHDTVEDNATEEKLRAISRLRMMASRYSLLERLDSDIPVPAVRASTFVGREAELNSLWQDWNAICKEPDSLGTQTWALIKGEPGTGKTALANRFIQQVRSDTSNPARLSIATLRMLNQTGHSTQATGLASLKNSIVDELRRLNLIYEESVGWFARTGREVKEGTKALANDARSDDPEAKKRVRAKLGRMISRLVGVDSAIEVARSAKSWSEQDDTLSLRLEDFGQSSQANHKEEQYELLRLALNEICQLALKCTPVVEGQPVSHPRPLILLIDDLQWMDDFTAEFLMNEWPADLPVYVITTARGSDSFSAAMESGAHAAMNRHRNQLFAELGLIDTAPFSTDPQEVLLLASHLNLKGMDQPMLANLIKLTYVGMTREQADQFARGVIRNLAGENSAPDVITLFAIETLNVISDSQFYKRNPELPRLIEPLGNHRYQFKAPESAGLNESLDTVFRKLTDTYQASYLVESGQDAGGARFNLASYAVLEERLHLIEQYFGEFGGTARYSLLFSPLLGSPFQTGLVGHVLKSLQQMSMQEHPDLAPFLQELQAQAQGSLTPAQYELLERGYEIIRRLEENTSRYVHQHSLLQQFLLERFTQLVTKAWPTSEELEKGIGELVKRIEASGNVWFSAQSKLGVCSDTDKGALEIERWKFLVALGRYWYQLMRGRTSKLGDWAMQYAIRLNNLTYTLNMMGRPYEALPLAKQAWSIRLEGYEADPKRWSADYAGSLNSVAFTYERLGRPSEAQPLLVQAQSVCREGYQLDPECWAEDYAGSLNNLASVYSSLGRLSDALALYEEAGSILSEVYELAPERWAKWYATNLNNQAFTHSKLGRPSKALPLEERTLSIFREGYESDPDRWTEAYARGLNNMASTLDALGRSSEALPLHKESLSIRCERYEADPERWAEAYATSLSNLAFVYDRLGRTAEALPLYEQSLSIRREGYDSDPQRWEEAYASSLNNLASTLDSLGSPLEALPLYSKALLIFSAGYKSDRERWHEAYTTSLNNLAVVYDRLGRLSEALPLYEQAFSIRREGYELDPERWAEVYANSLGNLAIMYNQQGRAAEALPLHEEALAIRREGYESDPDRWAEAFAGSLDNLAITYDEQGRAAEGMPLKEQARSIYQEGYESNPLRWAEDYANSLNNLANIQEQLGNQTEALLLHQETLSIRRERYEADPERWAKAYATSLNNLAFMYDEQGFAAEALLLYEQALSIRRKGYELDPERWAKDYAISLGNLAKTLEEAEDLSNSLVLWREAKELTADPSLLPAETRLDLRIESLIMSARLLRILERYPEARIELDDGELVLIEMDKAEHPARYSRRAWLLIVRATTLVEAGDLPAAKLLLPEAEKLICNHHLNDLGDALDLTREDIEAAEKLTE